MARIDPSRVHPSDVDSHGFILNPDDIEPPPSCSVCGVYPGHDIPAHVAAVKAEIQEGIADGSFPITVRTFSELHDWADANMLRGLGDSLSPLDCICGGEDNGCDIHPRWDEVFNLVTDEVSAWLAVGRTDAPLTPARRLLAVGAFIEAHSGAFCLTDRVHFPDAPAMSILALSSPDKSVVITADGVWLLDGLPATSPNGQPLAATDIYLVGWAVLDKLGVEYQR